MLQPDIRECSSCPSIPEILEQIDCTLLIYSRNELFNIKYALQLYYPRGTIDTLLHYKRILIARLFNNDYASCISTSTILSRIKTLGLKDTKDCCAFSN